MGPSEMKRNNKESPTHMNFLSWSFLRAIRTRHLFSKYSLESSFLVHTFMV